MEIDFKNEFVIISRDELFSAFFLSIKNNKPK